jgi:hypothetical protein
MHMRSTFACGDLGVARNTLVVTIEDSKNTHRRDVAHEEHMKHGVKTLIIESDVSQSNQA